MDNMQIKKLPDFLILINIIKSSLGSGILGMSYAFKCVGIPCGIILSFLIAILCDYCIVLLFRAYHKLNNKKSLSFQKIMYKSIIYFLKRNNTNGQELRQSERGEQERQHRELSEREYRCELSERNGQEFNYKKIKFSVKYLVNGCLFLESYGSCCIYSIMIVDYVNKVFNPVGFDTNIIKHIILFIMFVLIGMNNNLKILSYLSMVGNGLIFLTVFLMIYYCIDLVPFDNKNLKLYPDSVVNLLDFFCILLFTIECVGSVITIENKMKNPKNIYKLLHISITIITVTYVVFGLIGYIYFKDEVNINIIKNLDESLPISKFIISLITIATMCSYNLYMYTSFNISIDKINNKYYKNIIKILLIVINYLLAIAIPHLDKFIILIGGVTLSLLGVVFPIIIDFLMNYKKFKNFNTFKNLFYIIKNTLFISFGIGMIIFSIFSFFFL